MRKTATKMLILGVAVLTLLGAALTIKNGYAKSGVDAAELNARVEAWMERTRGALEAAGVPHTNAEPDAADSNAAALGESVSVSGRSGVNLMPWALIAVGLAGGASLLFVAVSKQYQPATREEAVAQAVNEIVAKNTRRAEGAARQSARVVQRKAGEFDDISRTVDEIVAKYQKDK